MKKRPSKTNKVGGGGCSSICNLTPLLTSNSLNQRKTKPALSFPDRARAAGESGLLRWITGKTSEKGAGWGVGVDILDSADSAWTLYHSEIQGQKHTQTNHLLPLASLRSARGSDLSGIDCHVCTAVCSSPCHFSLGNKIYMSPAIYGLFA